MIETIHPAAAHADAVRFLRDEFAAEKAAGFPRLKRIPETHTFRFLDYHASLTPEEQEKLETALADWNARRLRPDVSAPDPSSASYQNYERAISFHGFTGGLRYTPVTLLAGIAKENKVGGVGWWLKAMGFSGLALQPPEGINVDIFNLRPVKGRDLRKLVEAALARSFAPQVREIGDGIKRYDARIGASAVSLLVQFGRRVGEPQLRYDVTVHHPPSGMAFANVKFELLLAAGFGMWNYITEDNAEASAELLAELVAYLAEVPERLS
jgi:hypothetical protein